MAGSDVVAHDANQHADYVELGGHRFAIVGLVREQSISEFTTGIKIGPATYDEREHAFFLVLDDFSGGFAHRILNVREALGTHYDNTGGVDLRRPRHVTLPPLMTSIAPDKQPTVSSNLLFANQKSAIGSDLGNPGQGFLHVGVADAIYTIDPDRDLMTRRATLGVSGTNQVNRINRLLEFTDSSGTRAIYAFGFGDTNRSYWRTTDGVNWFEAGDTANWSNSVKKPIYDAIVFDNQIVAVKDGNRIISSADGTSWSDDLTPSIVHLTWNDFIAFIGVAPAPWGDVVPYFISGGKLHAFDFYRGRAVEIKELGDNLYLSEGTVWNGQIVVTNGQQVWAYNPAGGETIRDISPFGKQGLPPSWKDGPWQIVQFVTGTKDLFAVARGGANLDRSRILVYTGTGWTWFGREIVDQTEFDFGHSQFTLECWVKLDTDPNAASTPQSILSNGTGSYQLQLIAVPGAGTSGGYDVKLNKENVATIVQTNGPVIKDWGSNGWSGGWHHVVAVYDANNDVASIYVDGVQAATSSIGANQISGGTNELRIGKRITADDEQYVEFLDEVAVYNKVLSSSDISDHYTTGSDPNSGLLDYLFQVINDAPVGYWRLNETKGQFDDSSGKGNPGVETSWASISRGQTGIDGSGGDLAIKINSGAISIVDYPGATVYTSTIDRFPIDWSLSYPSRAIHVITDALGSSNRNVKAWKIVLPIGDDVPYQGSGAKFDYFAERSFETGWFDGGFPDLQGTLFRVFIDGFSISDNSPVKIEYRLNNDESGTWATLGTFNSPQQEIWFSEDRRGVPFYTIQFRITLKSDRDSLTPELKSLVLVYYKRPVLRRSWIFRIDITRSVELGYFLSVDEARDALRDLWNTSKLLRMVIPTVVPGGTNVRIAEIIGAFGGLVTNTSKLFVDMTVLEPVV